MSWSICIKSGSPKAEVKTVMSLVKSSSFLLFSALVSWTFVPAHAQVDPSTSLLLRGSDSAVQSQELDSNRYRVREPKAKDEPIEIDDEKSGTTIPTPVASEKPVVKAAAVVKPVAAPKAPVAPAAAATTPVSAVAPAAATAVPPATEELEPLHPPVTTQVRELIFGGNEEEIADYKKQIHPQDPRANVIEISLSPVYFYNDTSSSYSFHSLNSHGPGFSLGAKLWLSPFFGIHGESFSSLSSSVNTGSNSVASAEFNSWKVGIRFRKHFGYSRKAPHISYGLDYIENETKISNQATDVVGLRSKGASIILEATIPSSHTYASTMTIEINPRLNQSEVATGVAVSSGANSETNGIGGSFGGQWNLNQQNQIFWKLRHSVEKTLYKGSASQVDPMSGTTPSGVSVTNSLSMFYFGFRWGA